MTSTWPAYDTLYTAGLRGSVRAAGRPTPADASGGRRSHANGAYSMTDSPGGNYGPGVDAGATAPRPIASLSGRVGCQAAYNLRFDTSSSTTSAASTAVDRRLRQPSPGSGWSGSSRRIVPRAHVRLLRLRRLAASISVGLIMHANDDGIVADGGYLDDLRLALPEAERRGLQHDQRHLDGDAARRRRGGARARRRTRPYTVAQLVARSSAASTRSPALSGKVATGGRLNACKAVGGCGAAAPPPPPPFKPPLRGAERDRREAPHRDRDDQGPALPGSGTVTYVKSTGRRRASPPREPGGRASTSASNAAKVNLWLGRGPRRGPASRLRRRDGAAQRSGSSAGSGFYSFLDDVEEVELETPYGKPSAPFVIGELEGKRVAFLPRHGRNHELPPHAIPYRANVWAMKELGVRRIIGPNASGALKAELGSASSSSATSSSTARAAARTPSTTAPRRRTSRPPTRTARTCARCSSRPRASSGSRSGTAARSSRSRARASRRAPSRSGSRTPAGT